MKWWKEGIISDEQITTSYFLCEGHLLFFWLLQGESVVIHRLLLLLL